MAMAKDHPRFSPEEYDRRFREIRRRMAEKGIDVLILYGDSGSNREPPSSMCPRFYVEITAENERGCQENRRHEGARAFHLRRAS